MTKPIFSREVHRATIYRNSMLSDTSAESRVAAIDNLIQMIGSANETTVTAAERVIDPNEVQSLTADYHWAVKGAGDRLLTAINQAFGPRLGINPSELPWKPFLVAETIRDNRERSTKPLSFAEGVAALRSQLGCGVKIVPESATIR